MNCNYCHGHKVIEDWHYLSYQNGKVYDKWKDIIACPQCTKEVDTKEELTA